MDECTHNNMGEERRRPKLMQDNLVTDEYTLLHSKVLDGNGDFVKEINGDFLRRKPELACELDSQGQSPLHQASARGDVGVVKEILEADPHACSVRDRDGMIPLHLAAIKGRLDVLEELVNADIKTAYIFTDGGEPILHLCAKYHQFKALKKLVKKLLEKGHKNFVNLKDNDDNTILHALSAMNEPQIIKFLIKNAKADVSAMNKSGFTPLDVLLNNPPGIGRWKTQWFLAGAGAKSARLEKMMDRCRRSFSGARFSEVLFACAVLMAVVAFQAGVNPPGGVWQDTGYHNATLFSPNASESSPPELVHHFAGKSVMSYVDPKHYKCFSFFNNVAFYSSVLLIVLLLRGGHSWALKILSSISVVAISVSNACSLSFSSPYEKTVTRSWTFSTWVVLLYTSGILLSIIVNKVHFLAEVCLRMMFQLLIGLSLTSRHHLKHRADIHTSSPRPVDPGPTSKLHMKTPIPNENSGFASKSHVKIFSVFPYHKNP